MDAFRWAVAVRGLRDGPWAGSARIRGYRSQFVLAVAVGVSAFVGVGPSEAATERATVRQGPLTLQPYETRFTSRATRNVRAPRMDGHIVAMHARVVDGSGAPMPVRRVMLHHIVYKNAGRFPGDRRDGTCGGRYESFYGTGEEDEWLRFPPGYGYRIHRGERWKTGWMLMNHSPRRQRAYVEYTAWVDTTSRLTHVKPFWVRATGCRGARDPIFNVPGGRPAGSTFVKRTTWKVPVSGRLVAGGAHVHGGSKDIVLSQPRCGNRTLIGSRPLYGLPSHPYYNVLPVLHEPGPVSTSWVTSAEGFPVLKGESLRVASLYDAERPHTRVMGILHVYLAPAGRTVESCARLPTDVGNELPDIPGRLVAPAVTVPLTGLDASGRARVISRPPGPTRHFLKIPQVGVRENAFSVRNLSVPRGGLVRWRFHDRRYHDVTVASGPRGFASRWLRRGESYAYRFRRPGVYRLFCSLHPIDMTQVVRVRKRSR
jgi:hypothetical protein